MVRITKKITVIAISVILALVLLVSCTKQDKNTKTEIIRPNILWIFVEDISPHIASYGEPLVTTPTLDSLAKEGVMFSNVIMPAPVCSASRSAMITGVMQTTLGVHNHHSSRTKESAIMLPDSIKTLPELFKQAGYYTFNSGKDDYNFWYDRKALYEGDYDEHPLYGKRGLKTDWNARENKNQPFFGQIQLYGGKHIFNSKFKEKVKTPIDRSKIQLPPYYPNTPTMIEEWARYLESIQITDRDVSEIIQRLEKDGLLENTLVFFFADHGMRFLRHKQFLYEGGIKVPLIAYWKGQQQKLASSVREELVSGIDIGATSLAMAGIDIPGYFEGNNLFDPEYKSREFVISARDRCDYTIDRIRSVRTKRYKYIKNFMTDRPAMQANYRDEWDLTKEIRKLYSEGKLTAVQAKYFQPQRDAEELYDLKNDPHEINNLAHDPAHKLVLHNHRNILDNWIQTTDDQGQYPENEENLYLMLGIWGKYATNPEYDALRKKHPNLPGSLLHLKNTSFKKK